MASWSFSMSRAPQGAGHIIPKKSLLFYKGTLGLEIKLWNKTKSPLCPTIQTTIAILAFLYKGLPICMSLGCPFTKRAEITC